MKTMTMNRAFFLDRDGVINFDTRYLHEPGKVELVPGFAEGLKMLHRAGFLALVVTNQAGVARGMYGTDAVAAVHREIQRQLRDVCGEELDDFYICCHHEKITGPCECRKPAPGMLLRGASEHNVDLKRSFMVGDRLSDLEAGRNAGCRLSILVPSIFWEEHKIKAEAAGFPTAPDFPAAVELALRCGETSCADN